MSWRADLADLDDPVDIAATWGDMLFSGRVRELDWLTMRTVTVDLAGSSGAAEPLDRAGTCAYARALDRAFEDVAWRVARIEHREHEVRLDASLEARHAGPLDLSFRGGPTYPASNRRLRLPLQRLAWTIAHGRVLAFEVERGPGLGLDFVARELELAGEVDAERTPAPRSASNEHAARARQTPSSDGAREPSGPDARSRKPRIEDVIERARVEDPGGEPTGGS